jgi:hypothetical protein
MVERSSARMQQTSDRLEDSILGLLLLHTGPGHQMAATSEKAPFHLQMSGCNGPLEVMPEPYSPMYQIPESPAQETLLIGQHPA